MTSERQATSKLQCTETVDRKLVNYDSVSLKSVLLCDVDGCSNFDPGEGERDEQVGELAEREQCAAEDEAERSANVAHQGQRRIRRFSLDIRVLQIREKHLPQSSTEARFALSFLRESRSC